MLTRLLAPRNKTPVTWWKKNCAGDSTLRTTKRRDKEGSSSSFQSRLSGGGQGDKKIKKSLSLRFYGTGKINVFLNAHTSK